MEYWIPAIATVTSAIIGAGLGSFLYQVWVEKRKSNRIQKAILTEIKYSTDLNKIEPLRNRIEDLDEKIEADADMSDEYRPKLPELKLKLQELNFSDLGYFDEDVVENLIGLHYLIRHYHYTKNTVIEEDGLLATTIPPDEKRITKNLISILDLIIQIREELIDQLKD